MEHNLIGTLTALKLMGMKPNYSELARTFNRDRHTIKKMYEEKEAKIRRKKPSELDKYLDEIKEILSHPGTSIKATYRYFKNEKGIKCTYDNFKSFVNKKKILEQVKNYVPHPLYETDPGDQLQVDWVEDIKLTTTNGEILQFNLFSATLGYSRFHYFEYTLTKTETDFKRCLMHCFKKLGGVTKQVLTDNMSSIVNISGGKRNIHQSIVYFFKEIDVKLTLCKVRTPETKGKDEVSNKYAQRLYAYDGKISDTNHLLKIIDRLNIDINKQKNTATNLAPILLFEKEKEYLNPLPNHAILDSYEDVMCSCKVPSTFLISYRGAKYSVPPNLINKTVNYKEENGKLLIFYKNDLVGEHYISKKNKVNYHEDHYKSGIKGKIKNENKIDSMAKINLARFKDFGEY